MNASPVGAHIENILLIVMLQLCVIIAAARLFGALFRKMGQPQVCGEIAAGLILGPSLFGRFFPELSREVFNPAVNPVFSVMSQIGLVLLMFLIGLEFEFGHLRENRRAALSVSFAGIFLPFGLGMWLGSYLHTALGLRSNWLFFSLFMATAMSITAIPILGRIMMELRMNRSLIGSLTITAAAIDDAMGWVLLALVTAISQAAFDPWKFGRMVGGVLLFGAVMYFVVRPVAIRWIGATLRRAAGALSLNALAVVLLLIFVSAICTNLIGIFSIFGAFLLGAILSDQPEFVAAVRNRLSDFVTVFFLPIFFTYTGLRTDIGTMTGMDLWLLCGLVLLAATAGKLGGCTLAARWNGFSWRDASIIGVMMNTRALMELIVINIGFELGIIPRSVFFMLVFMAIFTTYMTAPVLRRIAPELRQT
ncbi:MAG: cation:proton antiporter [Bryobacterales bacterium]|nr:cation:proton antiporter [Bryobacterales bacterium]